MDVKVVQRIAYNNHILLATIIILFIYQHLAVRSCKEFNPRCSNKHPKQNNPEELLKTVLNKSCLMMDLREKISISFFAFSYFCYLQFYDFLND
jgi:hypothetical protein